MEGETRLHEDAEFGYEPVAEMKGCSKESKMLRCEDRRALVVMSRLMVVRGTKCTSGRVKAGRCEEDYALYSLLLVFGPSLELILKLTLRLVLRLIKNPSMVYIAVLPSA